MISFAGGLPSPASFPELDLQQIPKELLQYGASEGEPALREQICTDMRKLGLLCDPSQVLVLSGSQQGIDLVAKLMIDQGTTVALENPTYLAALQVFRFFGARFTSLDRDQPALALAQARQPSLCYTIPTFQNPTGYCYTQQQREALADACQQYGTVLFEDDPYRDLVYDDCARQPVCALMQTGSWIYQGSFSKTLAPGLRLGFLVASPDLMPYLIRLKQAADLHSNRLSQYLVSQALQSSLRSARINQLQSSYRHKRDAFNTALLHHLSAHAKWEIPKGGLFFWLKLRQPVDTQELLQRAIAKGVAFMPGEPFFLAPQENVSYLRLNFSHASEEAMDKGLAILRDEITLTHSRTARHWRASA
ncbi:MAG: PLP-dependent aminotransferase family protein [Pseudomonadota bacterium]